MGRVRKYKKFKACDPFSKKGKAEVDIIHDEPPEIHEDKVRKANQKRDRFWDDEQRREMILSREAMKFTVTESSIDTKKKEKKLEKRLDESMKEFKQRVRHETRATLKEELQALSSSRQKKKKKLKERTLKKKMKLTSSHGDDDDIEDEENDFRTAEDGRIRPSDLNGPSKFRTAEPISFGETLNAMPDLNKWKAALTKKMTKCATLDLQDPDVNVETQSTPKLEINDTIPEYKRKIKKTSITDIMNTDDSMTGRSYATEFLLDSNKNQNRNMVKKNNGGSRNNLSNIDALREESKLAYQKLKQNRMR